MKIIYKKIFLETPSCNWGTHWNQKPIIFYHVTKQKPLSMSLQFMIKSASKNKGNYDGIREAQIEDLIKESNQIDKEKRVAETRVKLLKPRN